MINIDLKNTFAGITTSLAMVPEVVAFALLAHLNPLVGLYAALVVGLVTAVFGGRPGMISGGAGSLAVVSVALVISHGAEYLFACVILMGMIQLVFGLLKLGNLIKMVSPAVMTGFVNGLALIIFTSQFTHLQSGGAWLAVEPMITMSAIIIATIALCIVSKKFIKRVPASLVSIVLVTAVVFVLGIATPTVGTIAPISGSLPEFAIPDVPVSWDTLLIIAPYSFLLAMIGLVETLLTARLVDNYPGIEGETKPNQESAALGISNVLTGFTGGMGGCAMIGQTVINLEAGGTGRWSGIVQALTIGAFIVFAGPIIEMIPISALIGIMFVVCYHTFDWNSIIVGRVSKRDTVVMIAVTLTTLFFNLAYAVLLGILLTSVLYYWDVVKDTQ